MSVTNMLEEAKQAVNKGDRAKAHQLLTNILEIVGANDPVRFQALWYLSYVEETSEGRLEYFKKVLAIYPNQETVLRRLEQLKSELMQEIRQAIEANDKAKARKLLTKLLDVDEHNEQVWLLFFQIAETDDERIDCLEQALAINPNNSEARNKLEDLKKLAETPIQPDFTLPDLEEQSIVTPLLSETTPEKPHAPALLKERPIRTWNNEGFRNEKDIIDDFIRLVDELLEIAKGMEPLAKGTNQ